MAVADANTLYGFLDLGTRPIIGTHVAESARALCEAHGFDLLQAFRNFPPISTPLSLDYYNAQGKRVSSSAGDLRFRFFEVADIVSEPVRVTQSLTKDIEAQAHARVDALCAAALSSLLHDRRETFYALSKAFLASFAGARRCSEHDFLGNPLAYIACVSYDAPLAQKLEAVQAVTGGLPMVLRGTYPGVSDNDCCTALFVLDSAPEDRFQTYLTPQLGDALARAGVRPFYLNLQTVTGYALEPLSSADMFEHMRENLEYVYQYYLFSSSATLGAPLCGAKPAYNKKLLGTKTLRLLEALFNSVFALFYRTALAPFLQSKVACLSDACVDLIGSTRKFVNFITGVSAHKGDRGAAQPFRPGPGACDKAFYSKFFPEQRLRRLADLLLQLSASTEALGFYDLALGKSKNRLPIPFVAQLYEGRILATLKKYFLSHSFRDTSFDILSDDRAAILKNADKLLSYCGFLQQNPAFGSLALNSIPLRKYSDVRGFLNARDGSDASDPGLRATLPYQQAPVQASAGPSDSNAETPLTRPESQNDLFGSMPDFGGVASAARPLGTPLLAALPGPSALAALAGGSPLGAAFQPNANFVNRISVMRFAHYKRRVDLLLGVVFAFLRENPMVVSKLLRFSENERSVENALACVCSSFVMADRNRGRIAVDFAVQGANGLLDLEQFRLASMAFLHARSALGKRRFWFATVVDSKIALCLTAEAERAVLREDASPGATAPASGSAGQPAAGQQAATMLARLIGTPSVFLKTLAAGERSPELRAQLGLLRQSVEAAIELAARASVFDDARWYAPLRHDISAIIGDDGAAGAGAGSGSGAVPLRGTTTSAKLALRMLRNQCILLKTRIPSALAIFALPLEKAAGRITERLYRFCIKNATPPQRYLAEAPLHYAIRLFKDLIRSSGGDNPAMQYLQQAFVAAEDFEILSALSLFMEKVAPLVRLTREIRALQRCLDDPATATASAAAAAEDASAVRAQVAALRQQRLALAKAVYKEIPTPNITAVGLYHPSLNVGEICRLLCFDETVLRAGAEGGDAREFAVEDRAFSTPLPPAPNSNAEFKTFYDGCTDYDVFLNVLANHMLQVQRDESFYQSDSLRNARSIRAGESLMVIYALQNTNMLADFSIARMELVLEFRGAGGAVLGAAPPPSLGSKRHLSFPRSLFFVRGSILLCGLPLIMPDTLDASVQAVAIVGIKLSISTGASGAPGTSGASGAGDCLVTDLDVPPIVIPVISNSPNLNVSLTLSPHALAPDRAGSAGGDGSTGGSLEHTFSLGEVVRGNIVIHNIGTHVASGCYLTSNAQDKMLFQASDKVDLRYLSGYDEADYPADRLVSVETALKYVYDRPELVYADIVRLTRAPHDQSLLKMDIAKPFLKKYLQDCVTRIFVPSYLPDQLLEIRTPVQPGEMLTIPFFFHISKEDRQAKSASLEIHVAYSTELSFDVTSGVAHYAPEDSVSSEITASAPSYSVQSDGQFTESLSVITTHTNRATTSKPSKTRTSLLSLRSDTRESDSYDLSEDTPGVRAAETTDSVILPKRAVSKPDLAHVDNDSELSAPLTSVERRSFSLHYSYAPAGMVLPLSAHTPSLTYCSRVGKLNQGLLQPSEPSSYLTSVHHTLRSPEYKDAITRMAEHSHTFTVERLNSFMLPFSSGDAQRSVRGNNLVVLGPDGQHLLSNTTLCEAVASAAPRVPSTAYSIIGGLMHNLLAGMRRQHIHDHALVMVGAVLAYFKKFNVFAFKDRNDESYDMAKLHREILQDMRHLQHAIIRSFIIRHGSIASSSHRHTLSSWSFALLTKTDLGDATYLVMYNALAGGARNSQDETCESVRSSQQLSKRDLFAVSASRPDFSYLMQDASSAWASPEDSAHMTIASRADKAMSQASEDTKLNTLCTMRPLVVFAEYEPIVSGTAFIVNLRVVNIYHTPIDFSSFVKMLGATGVAEVIGNAVYHRRIDGFSTASVRYSGCVSGPGNYTISICIASEGPILSCAGEASVVPLCIQGCDADGIMSLSLTFA